MNRLISVAACMVSLAVPVHAGTFTDFFTSFYSFGDSLTDDGKFGSLEAPSFGGRFTNGLTWSEHIEDTFTANGREAANFALGGATAGDTNLRLDSPLDTFSKQITAFQTALPALSPGSNPLVSVWFGANDIFQGFAPAGAADAVAAGIRSLSGIVGHSFDDFLVVSLPTIPGAPGAADAFNTQLASNIASLRGEGLNILTYDPAKATDAIVADFFNGSPIYGITDLTTPCAASLSDGDDSSCLDDGTDPNTLLFVDPVHPNAVAHELVGEQVASVLNASVPVIPLPAGFPLMLAGVGAFGLLRMRKAA